MSIVTPRPASGAMELMPREQIAFQSMLNTIQSAYERFGFTPIETPAFERREVLLTKSGGETEKQVFFLQSTGSLEQGHEPDLALRFDLTVPMARYVAQHERDLAFPFRRYQIQRVYRGERPQKGRFREFYQCDIDIIGKDKLDPMYDAEVPAIIAQIFNELNVGSFTINFSNRKVLLGLFAAFGYNEEQQKMCLREIDKLDKIGVDKVREALHAQSIKPEDAERILALTSCKEDNEATLNLLKQQNIDHPVFQEGVAEISSVLAALAAMGVDDKQVRLNLAITRGLDYYTGTVYETFINDHPEFGSVCSGGRYENLAGLYTKSKLPGVGISIGATRLFDLLRSKGWAEKFAALTQVIIAPLESELRYDALNIASTLRQAGINTEVYLEPAKLDKQLRYADKAGIPLMLLFGQDEKANGTIQLKDLRNKKQETVKREDIVGAIRQAL